MRYKTYNSTGVAPDGRLFAGDLNAIQDMKADLNNLAQTLQLANLQIGETGLQLLRYGALEARLTGAMRIDGIFRALGGIFAGTYTTAQRDAIPLGLRPYGLVILNSTTNRLEFNSGTDAVPVWKPVSEQQAGQIVKSMLAADVTNQLIAPGEVRIWPYGESTKPANTVLAYGQAISRAANPLGHAAASAESYPHGSGDGTTTFNIIDMRGSVPVGRDNMGGPAAGRISTGNNGQTLGGRHGVENVTLTLAQTPPHDHGGGSHSHTVNSHSHTVLSHSHTVNAHGHTVNSHSHGGVTGGRSIGHVHNVGLKTVLSGHGLTDGALYDGQLLIRTDAGSGAPYNLGTDGENVDHAHAIGAESPGTSAEAPGTSASTPGTSAEAPGTSASGAIITSQGGGGSHNNLQPGVIVNYVYGLG